MLAAVLFSVSIFYTFACIYNAFAVTCCDYNPPFWIAEELYGDPMYWAAQALIVVLAIMPRFSLFV